MTQLDRRDFIKRAGAVGLAAAIGGPLLAACSGSSTVTSAATATLDGDTRLRVGYLPITDATPLLLAHGAGYYADEGLDVDRPTLLRSWPQVAEAFQSRQVDLVHLLMPMTVQIRFGQDLPLRIVAWNHTGGSALTVGNEVDTIDDLAGTTVAVPFWYSIHNIAVQMMFEDAGLTPIIEGDASVADGTVKLVVMAPPDMPPALAAGSIAGYIVADPFNALAELNGIGRVLRFTGDVWLDHACCVAVMHEDAIRERPEWAQATVNALARAQLAARGDRVETARILSNDGGGYLPQPRAVIERALTHYDHGEYVPTGAITHENWDTDRIGFQPYPYESYTEALVRNLQRSRVDGERGFLDALDPVTAHGQLVEESLIRNAVESLGGPAAFGIEPGYVRAETIDV